MNLLSCEWAGSCVCVEGEGGGEGRKGSVEDDEQQQTKPKPTGDHGAHISRQTFRSNRSISKQNSRCTRARPSCETKGWACVSTRCMCVFVRRLATAAWLITVQSPWSVPHCIQQHRVGGLRDYNQPITQINMHCDFAGQDRPCHEYMAERINASEV